MGPRLWNSCLLINGFFLSSLTLMPLEPAKPDSPPPSPSRRSILTLPRKRRAISTLSQKNDVFVDDLKIAAAIKIHNEEKSDDEYYVAKVKEICNICNIKISAHVLHDVIRGVGLKCTKQVVEGQREESIKHYMTCSPERVERYRTYKAIMKRPPSLAPASSDVYRARHKLKERQLETKTVVDMKINEVYNCLQNDPQHIKFLYSKKIHSKQRNKKFQEHLQGRFAAVSFARSCIDTAVRNEVQRFKERNREMLERAIAMNNASTIVSKYWRRYAVMKEKIRALEIERLAEEAEEIKRRDKEREFLQRMKIRMTLLAL